MFKHKKSQIIPKKKPSFTNLQRFFKNTQFQPVFSNKNGNDSLPKNYASLNRKPRNIKFQKTHSNFAFKTTNSTNQFTKKRSLLNTKMSSTLKEERYIKDFETKNKQKSEVIPDFGVQTKTTKKLTNRELYKKQRSFTKNKALRKKQVVNSFKTHRISFNNSNSSFKPIAKRSK